ncbi:hypothetical protein, partial [Mesorhizobium sp. M0323]|uniref:hypothetical protein n=1 Tax=Mesorhizobium sp. M0323 TaxID=2956938 RepID=UPI00333CF895
MIKKASHDIADARPKLDTNGILDGFTRRRWTSPQGRQNSPPFRSCQRLDSRNGQSNNLRDGVVLDRQREL